MKVLSPYKNENHIEAGVDEVGRGPLFGPVVAAAVILPNDDSFPHHLMKDSKKFTSFKKLSETAEIIRTHAIDYSIAFVDNKTIDKLNILRATHQAMRTAVGRLTLPPDMILVDGDTSPRFPYSLPNSQEELIWINSTCVLKGDDTFSSIAAASILAKEARDLEIKKICSQHPIWNEHYGLLSNKGYGTKAHMDGIKQFGITDLHRKSFGPCSGFGIQHN